MLVDRNTITALIPQAEPMVMIDSLLRSESATTVTDLTIRPENIFVKDGFLQAPGLVENIAQTAAARAGYEAKKNGGPVALGFIGAVKDLTVTGLPKVGQRIETTVIITNQVMDVTIIKGTSMCEGKQLASCEMKIFIKPD